MVKKARSLFQKAREKLKWIDPFHYVDLFVMPRVNPGDNKAIGTVVYIVSAFVFAWTFLFLLGLLLGTSSSMVIVMSASMEPVLHRGDVVVLQGFASDSTQIPSIDFSNQDIAGTPLQSFVAEYVFSGGEIPQLQSINFSGSQRLVIEKEGPIIIYYSEWQKKPIIHRAIAKLVGSDGIFYITKGDSVYNNTVDQHCGKIVLGIPEKNCINFYPVRHDEARGRVIATIPLIGCAKIWLMDNIPSMLFTGRLPEDFKGVC